MDKKASRAQTLAKLNKFLRKSQEEEKPEETEDTEADEAADEAADEELEGVPEDLGGEGEDAEVEDKPEDLEDKVDKIVDTLDVVVDALEDQKEVLEDLSGHEKSEEEMSEDFDEFAEEYGDTESGDVEFGLETNEFGMAGASKMNKKDLRARRLARMRQYKKGTTISDEYLLDKMQNKPDLKGTPVVQPVKDMPSRPATPDMLKVAELQLESSEDGSKWTILDRNSKPVYIINRGSLDPKAFGSPNFAKQVIRDLHTMGMAKGLKKYNAQRAVSLVAKTTKVASKVVDTASVERRVASDFTRKFARAVRLAVTAMNKNLVKPVPLKAALVEILSDLGVEQPFTIVESAFKKAAHAHFETVLATAEKFMSMGDEAFVETEAMIGKTDTLLVVDPENEEDFVRSASLSDRANELRNRAEKGSISVTSSSDEDVSQDEDLLNAIPKPALYSAALRGRKS